MFKFGLYQYTNLMETTTIMALWILIYLLIYFYFVWLLRHFIRKIKENRPCVIQKMRKPNNRLSKAKWSGGLAYLDTKMHVGYSVECFFSRNLSLHKFLVCDYRKPKISFDYYNFFFFSFKTRGIKIFGWLHKGGEFFCTFYNYEVILIFLELQ